MQPENTNINQKFVEQFGSYLLYAEMALKDRKKFNERYDEYEKAIAQIMPCPPFDWNESKASIDNFCETMTKAIVRNDITFEPLCIVGKNDNLKNHLLHGMIWREPVIYTGSNNLLAHIFHELYEKLVVPDKKNIHHRVSLHFVKPNCKHISARLLANELEKGMTGRTKKIIAIIMQKILK